MAIIFANKDNFQDAVAKGTVILDFYADWCAPCRMIGPVLEQIAEENSDIKVVKVDVENNIELANQFEVRGIPALFVLKDGKTVAQRAGFMPKDALVDWVRKA
ncbi:MAG: thioredoxin [Candidatus Izimaplasma sp.]|nr:thioredoxin [Candidatus Izimaplasma bacterium]